MIQLKKVNLDTIYSPEQVNCFIIHSNLIEREPGVPDIDSVKALSYLLSHKKLTKEVILEAHRLLMVNKDIESRFKGRFRDIGVRIGGIPGLDFKLIDSKFNDWLEKGIDIYGVHLGLVRKILANHRAFERIHPFVDGNGRLGRLILLWFMNFKKLPFRYIDYECRSLYYSIFGDDGLENTKNYEKFFKANIY